MAVDIVLGRTQSDMKKFGTEGTILIAKQYVKMGQVTSLSNKVYMDVAKAHVVFVAGKRGGGKCLHGDTLITLEDGSQVPIKDIEKNNKQILSMDNNLKIHKKPKSEFFSRKVDRLFKIKLRSGKEIKLTPEHPLYTIKSWQPAESLTIGSRIATPRTIPSFGNKEMPDHEVKLLSYLIAEGHTKSIVLFANSDTKIVEDFRDALYEFDNSLELIKDKKDHYRISSPQWKTQVLSYNNDRNEKGQFTPNNQNMQKKRTIRHLIEREEIFGKLATEKYLSQNIMKLNKEKLALFLNRLFSCDGSIYKSEDTWKSCYSSSSQQMIKQIQHLLLRFGILSKLRNKKIKTNDKIFQSYELVLNSVNTLRFIEQIGFFGGKQIKQVSAREEITSKIQNPNIDTIPKGIWEYYKPDNWAELGRQLGYKHPKAMRERIKYAPSRQTLLQISKVEQNTGLQLLATSDIFWDEIVAMEILEGNFTVYDICVPEDHNFIANDIIVHNSYTMGVIAEGMVNLPEEVSQNLSVILLDTMGIYWTMKYPNHKDDDLLKEWGLEGKGLDVKIFTPSGFHKQYKEQGIPTDFPFSIKPSELSASDWSMTFGITTNDPIGVLIERAINVLKKQKPDYSIKDIIKTIKDDKRSDDHVKAAAENHFLNTESWGLFSTKGTEISELAIAGSVSVLDVSCYATQPNGWAIKSIVIGLVAQKLFIERMVARKNEEYDQIKGTEHYIREEEKAEAKLSMPLVWLVIDEAHEFLPVEGKTAASDALVTILREGRQPGISLILATQQPGKIHTDVMTQSDIIISHRITAKLDTDALGMLMQSYMRLGLDTVLNNLPRVKGSAIIIDDQNERMYPVRIRPRFTWHGGEAPMAVRKKKKQFEF